MDILIQVDGENVKSIKVDPTIKDQKLWLFTILYKDMDVRAAVVNSLKRVVHVPNKLVNLITK